MGTILSIETPDELRALDAKLSKESTAGRIFWSLAFAAGGVVVLVFALSAGSVMGVVVSFGWIVLWTAWIVRYWRKLRAARQYRVEVRLGVQQIGEAHNIFRRLSDQSTHYALPVVLAMYSLSRIEVYGETGEQTVAELMQERVDALRGLLNAEDAIRLSTESARVVDRDDLIASKAYKDALSEVVAVLQRGY